MIKIMFLALMGSSNEYNNPGESGFQAKNVHYMSSSVWHAPIDCLARQIGHRHLHTPIRTGLYGNIMVLTAA